MFRGGANCFTDSLCLHPAEVASAVEEFIVACDGNGALEIVIIGGYSYACSQDPAKPGANV